MSPPNIDDVRALAEKVSNWGRWGPDDERGTLNLITPERVVRAAGLVRTGRTVSLALPFDSRGPQEGGFNRFNPIHLMLRDGADALAGTMVRDFYGGRDGHVRGTDDIVIMPLQCGTQWDALSHVVFDGQIYNGYSADQVTSVGALKNDVTAAQDRLVARGVLLDMARHLNRTPLEDGYVITADDLRGCADAQGVSVGEGDIVLVRTGQLPDRQGNGWRGFAGGDAPGLGLEAVEWIAEKQLAGIATDTWGMEVRPNQTPDVSQPLHIILLVFMGLWIGEIWHMEELSVACRDENRYEFMLCAPPLPFTGAVGSPVNPVAVL
ncbi:cyclase family protein [Pseudonocardia kujensis]|uniref:cyclase family protein n=1 Tax=Pseudonocardia kujensis TaxID=1128675 RepID=UPI001E6207CE|nr:cyclase family protein [Pseudonocardia kujensis]MCE0764080.1 cyclase family protein [Pseudonocardia kujensis]